MDKNEMRGKLWEEWTQGVKILGDGLAQDQLGIINAACSTVLGGETFIEKAVMFVQRKYYISKFKDYKAKIAAFEKEAVDTIRLANEMLDEKSRVAYKSTLSAVFMDADDSFKIEEWGDHAIEAYEKLVECVNELVEVLGKVLEALENQDGNSK